MSKYDAILNYLEGLDDDSLCELHNTYCSNARCSDNRIYAMDDLDEVCDGETSTDLALKIHFGEFNPTEKWFWFDANRYLYSSDDTCGMPIYLCDIAGHICDEDDDLEDCGLRQLLDEYAEEEEDEED